MKNKNLKYIYLGMLGCVLFIGLFFYLLWQKQDKENVALDNAGVKVKAHVDAIYGRKLTKKSYTNYYMTVSFEAAASPSNQGSTSQTIELGTYEIAKQYADKDTVIIEYLPEDPGVLRLVK